MRPLAFFLALAAAAACGPLLTPPTGPDTSYPCGVRGRSCGDGMCCGESDVCGGEGDFARCPPGYCCFDGPAPWPGAAPLRRRQWGAPLVPP